MISLVKVRLAAPPYTLAGGSPTPPSSDGSGVRGVFRGPSAAPIFRGPQRVPAFRGPQRVPVFRG